MEMKKPKKVNRITAKDYIKANRRARREQDVHFPHKAHKMKTDYNRKESKKIDIDE
jgi:hypothetical protein